MNLSEGNNFNAKGNFLECKNIFSDVMTISCTSNIKTHYIFLYLKNCGTVFSSFFPVYLKKGKGDLKMPNKHIKLYMTVFFYIPDFSRTIFISISK